MPFQDGNRSASGGSVCDAFLKSVYYLLAKGETGKGMLMPCLLEVFGQIWITVVLQDLGSLLLTSLPWSQPPELCLLSQLCSYSPNEPSLQGPWPSPDV